MPARRFALGVTGHRLNQVDEADRPAITRGIGEAMRLIADAAAAAGGAESGALRGTLVSALAEGVDRFAAHEALASGWRLAAPLPFPVERYLADFKEAASKREFHELLAQAGRVSPPETEQGYLAVGKAIIAQSDVLLAVWNGLPPRGPGGTADVAARALAAGRPVIWRSLDPKQRLALIEPLRLPRAGSFRRSLLEALRTQFTIIKQPPELRTADS